MLLWPLVAQHAMPPAEKLDVPGGTVTLPMEDIAGRPIVAVKIDGKGPYRFILDTGASATVVDEDLAAQLALRAPAAGPIVQPGGPMQRLVRINDLHIGEASLMGVVVAIGPLSRLFRIDAPPQGVLSAASFPGYLLILDYPAKRIVIRKGALPAPDLRAVFEYTAAQILPNVPVRVAGAQLRVHVDTGAPTGITLPTRYMKELPLMSEPVQAGHARTPHGEFTVWSAPVKGSIELGKFTLDTPAVRFSDVNPLPGPPTGNIGYEVLKRFVVTLDSKNRRVRFQE